jgi:NTE family protein
MTGLSALVLGGGGARGAYEVGVMHFLFEGLARQLGAPLHVPILAGNSAGAINVCGLGVHADDPPTGVARLAWQWRGLELERMVKPDRCEALRMVRGLLGGGVRAQRGGRSRGALLDPRPFRSLVAGGLPLATMADHLRSGRLGAVSVSATEVATGTAIAFVAASDRHLATGPAVRPVDRIRLGHVLASSAIPLLLPPVELDGRLYCDGSLRQHVPLSPALELGADRLVVVTTQPPPTQRNPFLEGEREQAAGSPLFMLGRAVDALTLDRVEDEVAQLERLNDLLVAGRRAFGERFDAELGRALASAGKPPLRPVELVVIRPSESLGRLAADLVRSPRFRGRLTGSLGRLFGRILDGEAEHEAELLSFLLFDGLFASELMALGREDARRHEAALLSLLAERAPAAAAG